MSVISAGPLQNTFRAYTFMFIKGHQHQEIKGVVKVSNVY